MADTGYERTLALATQLLTMPTCSFAVVKGELLRDQRLPLGADDHARSKIQWGTGKDFAHVVPGIPVRFPFQRVPE